MASKNTVLTLALGSAISATLASASAVAIESPFAAQTLKNGYMVAEADTPSSVEKTPEAKCGATKAKAKTKAKEGKCGGKKGAADANANTKMLKEGKCGEGVCGAKNIKEGRCGGSK
jgi:uncharacterized low-complexity protein